MEPVPAINLTLKDLRAAMSAAPQAQGLITRHYRTADLYCRELWRPAGCIIMGKVHRREHLYIVASGTVRLMGNGEPREIIGPAVVVSLPGTQRAVQALTDATCITVHCVSDLPEDADMEAIEGALVEHDPGALFGPGNVPLTRPIEAEAMELLP